MTTTAHNSRRVYAGAIRPVTPPPDRKTIWADDDDTQIVLHDAERRQIPFSERCTYEEFLRHLNQVHGGNYLCRPDGTPLQPRKESAQRIDLPLLPTPASVAPVIIAPVPVVRSVVELLAQVYHPQLKRAGRGSNIMPILNALANGPLTHSELVNATSMTPHQVKNTLEKFKGKYVEKLSNKSKGNKWAILGSAPIAVEVHPLIRERIEAHLAQHDSCSANELAAALQVTVRTVTGMLYSGKCNAVKQVDGDRILWGKP